MGTGQRLATLLVVLALVGAPAVALRAMCIGNSCDEAPERSAVVPFCTLDARTRELVTAGFYADRSPDALGVTNTSTLVTGVGGALQVPWPSTTTGAPKVPIMFLGRGIERMSVPPEARLDQIAPTLEPLLGIRRPHPEVRSGTAIDGLVRPGTRSPLVMTIVWRGVGMADLEDANVPWPPVPPSRQALRIAVGQAAPGSLPLDPAAILTTIGSGALPSEHGITGTFVRDANGAVVRAFSPRSPLPVVAALGDDLVQQTDGAKIALVSAGPVEDRGLIGGGWYGGPDPSVLIDGAGDPVASVTEALDRGFGSDAVPDLLGVVLDGAVRVMEDDTLAIVDRVLSSVPDATVVVTSTGSVQTPGSATDASTIVDLVDATVAPSGRSVIAREGTSGLFLDRREVAAAGISTQQVVDAMQGAVTPTGGPLFADAFPSFAVQFGRYC
jgi:hypothetical protein